MIFKVSKRTDLDTLTTSSVSKLPSFIALVKDLEFNSGELE